MRNFRITIIVGSALMLSQMTVANAADFGGATYGDEPVPSYKSDTYKPILQPAPEPIPVESSGFYVRGDATYSDALDFDAYEGIFDLSNEELDDSFGVGGGIGYNFSSHIRGDLTLDYFFDHDGYAYNRGGCCEVNHFTTNSLVGLANIYYDFGNRARFSPYIGLGLGFANNEINDRTVSINCGCNAGKSFDLAGDTETSVAAAAMFGFSAHLKENLLLDAGYRFLYLGDAHSGSVSAAGQQAGITDSIDLESLRAHQVRVGFRYEIY